ncbi:ankyrin repeat domain-containing protein 50 [Microdochium nivale]|nr:ankyrin repeat domain-containing protein 50 [Microdochium nivale]
MDDGKRRAVPAQEQSGHSGRTRERVAQDRAETTSTKQSHCDYEIAWICTSLFGFIVAKAMMDQIHENLPVSPHDSNYYILGRVGSFNIILATHRNGFSGLGLALSNIRKSFTSIRLELIVGLAHGLPTTKDDVRLGDVVVGLRTIQWELFQTGKHHIQDVGFFFTQSARMKRFLATMQAEHNVRGSQIPVILEHMKQRHPEMSQHADCTRLHDVLFKSTYTHVGFEATCDNCDRSLRLSRSLRNTPGPKVHWGTIAFGNLVINDASRRDQIALESSALCFMNETALPQEVDTDSLIISGIYDYADSHKNKQWQQYATCVAASHAREILCALTLDALQEDHVSSTLISRPHHEASSGDEFAALLGGASGGQQHHHHHPKSTEIQAAAAYTPASVPPSANLSASTGGVFAELAFDNGMDWDYIMSLSPLPWQVPPHRVLSGQMSQHMGGHDRYPVSMTEKIQRFIRSFAFAEMHDRRHDIAPAHGETCRWLLTQQGYCDWLDVSKCASHHGSLWIRGKPGAGKSTLMKFVLDEMSKDSDSSTVVISFFFHKDGSEMQKSIRGLYQSLILQLLIRFPYLQTLLLEDRMRADPTPIQYWTVSALQALLLKAVYSIRDTRLLCLIDAVDECESDEIRQMISFFGSLSASAAFKDLPFYICYSSRHYPHIAAHRGVELDLDNQEGHERDITNYTKSRLNKRSDTFTQELETEVMKKASGVFLWAVEVISELNQQFDRGDDPTALRQVLHQSSSTMHTLFRDCLMRGEDTRDQTLSCLQCVLYATRPLTPTELYLAVYSGTGTAKPNLTASDGHVSTKAAAAFVRDASKGLLEVTRSGHPVVQFIHESAIDFLLGDEGLCELSPGLGTSVRGISHDKLKSRCLDYIQRHNKPEELDKHKTRKQEWEQFRNVIDASSQFLKYAIRNVMFHAEQAQNRGLPQDEFLLEFSGILDCWVIFHNIFEKDDMRRYKEGVSLLYLLAERDCAGMIHTMTGKRSCLTIEGQRYGAPLLAALSTESYDAASACLAMPKGQGSNRDTNAEQLIASKLTLECKSPRSRLNRHFHFSKTDDVMFLLAEYGNDEIFRIILSHLPLDVYKKDRFGRTILFYAVSSDRVFITRTILEHAADTESVDITGQTPLSEAAKLGCDSVVRVLLQSGAVPESVDSDGRTPLSYAAEKGHYSIVETLLDYGADPNSTDACGYSSLYHASLLRTNREQVINVLLAHGAVSNTKTHEDKIPSSLLGKSPSLGTAATPPLHHLETMLPIQSVLLSEDTCYSTIYTRHGLSSGVGELSTLPSHECSTAPTKRAPDDAIPGDDRSGGLEHTDELDDVSSEYSEAGSLAAIEDSYSAALAEKIRADLRLASQQISVDDFEQFTAHFPELLKAFSADISYRLNNNIGRDAGFHVYKNRKLISQQLKSLLQLDLLDRHHDLSSDSNSEASIAEPTSLEPIVDWTERQQRVSEWTSVISDTHLATLPDPYFNHHLGHDDWVSDAEAPSFEAPSPETLSFEAPSFEAPSFEAPSFDKYRTALDESGAYKWLLASMQTHFSLRTSPTNTIQNIGKTIKGQLPRERISRRKPTPRHKLSIAVDWQPFEFLLGQGYHLPPQEVVSEVLVLTGTPRHAQASTCLEYMQRTWPVTGFQTLQCVQKILCHGADDFHGAEKVITDDGELSLQLSDGYLLAIVTGSEAFLSEVGEQLAWMGAAMRRVREETELTVVSPAIKRANQQSPISQPPNSQGTTHCDIHFTMTFSEQGVYDTDATDISRIYSNGQCWHALFGNSVIVDGFPISRRESSDTGLEVNLELMAALTDASRVNIFQGIPMIKGFSRLLFPLQKSTDTITWHLVYNQNGSHISFMEGITCHSIGLELGVIEKSRHIIGWCKEAELYVGAPDANHPVCSSTLAKDPWKTGFEDRVLEIGRLISSQGIVKGSRDIPRHLSRNKDYYTQMMWLQTRKIILWDEGDKRGWLADGLSVLLHLLRAHILHHSTGQFRRIFKLKPDSLQFGGNTRSPEASLQILLDPDNLNLAVFPDGDVRLKHKVLDFYNFLEQAVDHQDAIDRHCRRAQRSSRSRGKLEGWDFKEFVTLSDFVEPRTADLGTAGRSWVDLTRSMRTAVLFGQNFGDMIMPSQFSEHCTWAQVPTGQFLLTALVQDLGVERIHSTSGRITTTIQGGDLEWHSPGGITFQQCPCSDQSSSVHHNFIQVLLPRNTSNEFPIQEPSISQTHPLHPGAVIFGYNSHFGWQWDDRGVLTRSELSTPVPTEGDEHTLSPPQSSDNDSDSAHGTPADAVSFEPEIGIICALSKELRAILTLFECRETKPLIEGDPNHYSYGHLAGYRVVAAALPHGIYGISTAGSVATHLRRSFPRLHFCLLVGIGAGVPRLHKNIDIRLGDVVVGVSPDGSADLVWNGKGKRNDGTLETSRHTLQGPPSDLRRLITSLQSDPENGGCCRLKPYLDRIKNKCPEYAHPGVEHDKLYTTNKQKQPAGTENSSPQHEQLIPREGRPTTRPYVHYGPIATGDVLVKDAELRDRLGEDLNVHCIEMEAGGITNEIPCLVIRGICDYADNRKNDDWQEYAAATAAAYAAYLLTERRGFSVTQARTRRKGKRLAGEELQGRRKARRV